VTGPAPTRSWPRDALPRGTVLNGYRIVDILGRGGFGITYKAADGIDQVFAVKEYFPRQFAIRQDLQVLPPDDAAREMFDECLDRFTREARALTLFSGQGDGADGVVRVITYFAANGTAYIVMEYLEGETFDRVIAANPQGLSEAELTQILRTLVPALGRVHDNGLLHRDIKPANIFLRGGWHPVLLDFGAARTSQTGQTEAYTSIFTETYAPIEQIEGRRQGPYSDIYALGVTCYRAIAGHTADTAGTMSLSRQAALLRKQPDPLRPATEIGAGRYSQRFLSGIDAALRVSPEDRPQDVRAFAQALGLAESPAAAADDATRLSGTHAAAPRISPMVEATVKNAARIAPAPAVVPASPAAPRGAARRAWGGALVVAVAVLAGIGGGAVYALWPRLHAPAPSPFANTPQIANVTAPPKQHAVLVPPVQAPAPAQANADAAADAAYLAANYATAFALYRALADRGDPHAQARLGTMYLNGLGVAGNAASAVDWYRRSAAQDYAPAEEALGRIYLQGLAGPKDFEAAAQWYNQAAAHNFANAEYGLGLMAQRGLGRRPDFQTMLIWYRRAALHGSGDAAQQLGYAYQEGFGVKVDLTAAVGWYRQAANRNNSTGMFSLGQMYYAGLGVEQNKAVGRNWIEQAAAAGSSDARLWLSTH
jgi:serine/threonine protein kinase